MLDAVEKQFREADPEKGPERNPFIRAFIRSWDLRARYRDTLKQGWVIESILPESSTLGVIFGPPGTYKSFLAIDMGASVSEGIPWHGREVKQRPVFYIAAESPSGVLKRLEALRQHHGIEEIKNFTLLPRPALIDEKLDLHHLIEAIQSVLEETDQEPPVVFIDTLAKNMSGDENSTPDMNAYVRAAQEITLQTKAIVIIVHHTGKDASRGARGSIALEGGCDTMFRVQKVDKLKAALVCERQKDFQSSEDLVFDLLVVDTGDLDADGNPVTSLVPILDPDAKLDKQAKRPALTGAARIAWDALGTALADYGEDPPEEVRERMEPVLPGDKVVHEDQWREVSYRLSISSTEKGKRLAFWKARNKLTTMGKVKTWDGFYWKA